MIGQVVLLRLAEQYTLAAISAEHTVDDVDVRAFALYADGHLGVVELAHVTRGTGVDQWQEPPWPVPEPVIPAPLTLADARGSLMPVSQLPSSLPMMVIIRY